MEEELELDFDEDDLFQQAHERGEDLDYSSRTTNTRTQAQVPVPTPVAAPVQPRSPTPPRIHNPRLDSMGNPLPAPWESKVSTSKGDIYYKNTVTGKSSWEIPIQEVVKEKSQPTAPATAAVEAVEAVNVAPTPVKLAVHSSRAALIPTANGSHDASGQGNERSDRKTEDTDARNESRQSSRSEHTSESQDKANYPDANSRKPLPTQGSVIPNGPRPSQYRGRSSAEAPSPSVAAGAEHLPTGPKSRFQVPRNTPARGPTSAEAYNESRRAQEVSDTPRSRASVDSHGDKWATSSKVEGAPTGPKAASAGRPAPRPYIKGNKPPYVPRAFVPPPPPGPRRLAASVPDDRWARSDDSKAAPSSRPPPRGAARPQNVEDLDASLDAFTAQRSPGSPNSNYRDGSTGLAEARPRSPSPMRNGRDVPPHRQNAPTSDNRRRSPSPPRSRNSLADRLQDGGTLQRTAPATAPVVGNQWGSRRLTALENIAARGKSPSPPPAQPMQARRARSRSPARRPSPDRRDYHQRRSPSPVRGGRPRSPPRQARRSRSPPPMRRRSRSRSRSPPRHRSRSPPRRASVIDSYRPAQRDAPLLRTGDRFDTESGSRYGQSGDGGPTRGRYRQVEDSGAPPMRERSRSPPRAKAPTPSRGYGARNASPPVSLPPIHMGLNSGPPSMILPIRPVRSSMSPRRDGETKGQREGRKEFAPREEFAPGKWAGVTSSLASRISGLPQRPPLSSSGSSGVIPAKRGAPEEDYRNGDQGGRRDAGRYDDERDGYRGRRN